MKVLIFILLCTSTLFAQTNNFAPNERKKSLKEYCGNYLPSINDRQLGAMSIILKEGKLYRHLDSDTDKLLVSTSNDDFVYAEDLERKIEFAYNNIGQVVHLILYRPDGVFFLQKIK